MHLIGVGSVSQDVHNTPVSVCGQVTEVDPGGAPAAAAVAHLAAGAGRALAPRRA